MADIEFFWDPGCPWAWITSRWVHEVIDQRGIEVDWRLISLRILNEANGPRPAPPEGFSPPPGFMERMELSQRTLRVAAAIREELDPAKAGDLYTAVGTLIHVEGAPGKAMAEEDYGDLLESIGIPRSFGAAGEDERWEDVIRASTEEALTRTGREVGTPVLTFEPPDGPSYFGPVLNRIPRGDEALELFDAVRTLVHVPGFAELKRSDRGTPQTA